MAKANKGKQYNKKVNTDRDSKKKKQGSILMKYKYFAKSSLAAYHDEDGCPLYLGDASDEKEFFKSGNIASTRKVDNCELLGRMGMSLCLSAATFHNGIDTIAKRCKTVGTGLQSEPLGRMGLPELAKWAESSEGKEFAQAIQVLNTGKTKRPAEKDVKKAMRSFIAFFNDNGNELRKHLARCASFSATMYLFTMTLLEHIDLHENRATWAKRMKDSKKHGKAVQAWLKKPDDDEKLHAALTEAFCAKVKTHKKDKSKKKKAADSSSEAQSSGGSGSKSASSSSASSSSASKKHGGKKGGKDKRSDNKDKRKTLSSSSSAAPSEKIEKKDKKRKKDDTEKKDVKRKRGGAGQDEDSKEDDADGQGDTRKRSGASKRSPGEIFAEQLKEWAGSTSYKVFFHAKKKIPDSGHCDQLDPMDLISVLSTPPHAVMKSYYAEVDDLKLTEPGNTERVQALIADKENA